MVLTPTTRTPGPIANEKPSPVSEDDGTDYEWDLDDAQEEVSEARSEDNQKLLASALQPEPAAFDSPRGHLKYPVILPQRRPKKRHRGFIRAYAPDLLNCGIDQATFLAFLDELDKSTAWSPIADIINLSTLATFAIPGGLGAAVSVPIQLATGIYKELQGRKGFDRPSLSVSLSKTRNSSLADFSRHAI